MKLSPHLIGSAWVAAFLLSVASPALAAICEMRLQSFAVPGSDGAALERQEILGPDDKRRLVVPSSDCVMSVGVEHGTRGFMCGMEFEGRWGTPDNNLRTAFRYLKLESVKVPRHVSQEEWLAPLDMEGVTTGPQPTRDDYLALYPRQFIAISPKENLPDTESRRTVQVLRYRTMSHQVRAAITGEVTFGCLRLHFVTWAAPEDSEAAKVKMIGLLKGLRLRDIERK